MVISLKDKPSFKQGKYIHLDLTQDFIDSYQTGKTVKDDGLLFYEIDNLKGKRGWTISKPNKITEDKIKTLINKVIENDNKINNVLVDILPLYDNAMKTNAKGVEKLGLAYFQIHEAVAKRQKDIVEDKNIKAQAKFQALNDKLATIKTKIWKKLGFGDLGIEPVTMIIIGATIVASVIGSIIAYQLTQTYNSKLQESTLQLSSIEEVKKALEKLPISTAQKEELVVKLQEVEKEHVEKVKEAEAVGYNQGKQENNNTIASAIKYVAIAAVVGGAIYAGVKIFAPDEKTIVVQPQQPTV